MHLRASVLSRINLGEEISYRVSRLLSACTLSPSYVRLKKEIASRRLFKFKNDCTKRRLIQLNVMDMYE